MVIMATVWCSDADAGSVVLKKVPCPALPCPVLCNGSAGFFLGLSSHRVCTVYPQRTRICRPQTGRYQYCTKQLGDWPTVGRSCSQNILCRPQVEQTWPVRFIINRKSVYSRELMNPLQSPEPA